MEKNPHCVWMNYLAVELYKRIEWGYSTTQICRLLAICVRVHATPAGLNSWWGHVVLPAPVCHLSVISSCISDVFSKHPVCVCDHSTFTAVTTAHLLVQDSWRVFCLTLACEFLMCLFSLGALPCQTIWRGELLGEFKRPLGL